MSSNGWETFVPEGPSSKFEKYRNQSVIVISGGNRGKSRGKRRLILTDHVMKLLGNPLYIKILTRGQNIGLMKSETNEEAYTVMRSKHDGKKIGMSFLNIHALSARYDLDNGAYEAHNENGVIVFDTRSRPSKL